MDGIKAKPAKEVKVGQKLILNLTKKKIGIEILKLPSKGQKKSEVQELYRIISEEKREDSFF